jgi:hypothetical protein
MTLKLCEIDSPRGFSKSRIDCTLPNLKNASLIQKRDGCIEAKMKKFGFSPENRRSRGFSRWGIDCAYSRTMKKLLLHKNIINNRQMTSKINKYRELEIKIVPLRFIWIMFS